MTLITLLLVLNLAAVAVIWRGYRDWQARDDALRVGTVVAGAALAGLVAAISVGESVLDALDISDATFRIAAGAIVVFGALQAFLGIGLRHELASRAWLIVASLVWLLAPPGVVVAVAIALDDGVGTAVGVALVAVAVALTGAAWTVLMGERYELAVGLLRRTIAAGAVFGGVDLIRQGVLSI